MFKQFCAQILIPTLFFCQIIYAQKPILKIDSVEKEHFIYYFDDTYLIESADSILNSARKKMFDLIKIYPSYKPSIYLLNGDDDFKKVTRGLLPHWGAAAAFPSRKLIAVKSPLTHNLNKSLSALLFHEYSHLLLEERTGYNRVPRWFNEGLAMYVSTEWSWSDNIALGKASAFGNIIRLPDIEEVNRFSASKAHVAYAESYMAVKYFLDEYGKSSLNIFLNELAKGESVADAFLHSTGSNYKQFNNDYNIFILKQFNLSSLFMDTLFLWLFLAGVVLFATFKRYKKKKEYYKKWEEEEKLHSTDFDYGDPDQPEKLDDDESWRS